MGSQVIEAILSSTRDALLDALQKGGNPNDDEDGTSALTMACVQDREDLAGDLIRHGARVNLADQDRSTPIFIAAGLGSESLTRVLLQAGADVTAANDIGQTPLMVAAKSGNSEVVAMLLKEHADVRARDKRGLSAIHWAIVGGDFAEVVQLLLLSGGNSDDKTVDGQSALDYAVSLKRKDTIDVLAA